MVTCRFTLASHTRWEPCTVMSSASSQQVNSGGKNKNKFISIILSHIRHRHAQHVTLRIKSLSCSANGRLPLMTKVVYGHSQKNSQDGAVSIEPTTASQGLWHDSPTCTTYQLISQYQQTHIIISYTSLLLLQHFSSISCSSQPYFSLKLPLVRQALPCLNMKASTLQVTLSAHNLRLYTFISQYQPMIIQFLHKYNNDYQIRSQTCQLLNNGLHQHSS